MPLPAPADRSGCFGLLGRTARLSCRAAFKNVEARKTRMAAPVSFSPWLAGLPITTVMLPQPPPRAGLRLQQRPREVLEKVDKFPSRPTTTVRSTTVVGRTDMAPAQIRPFLRRLTRAMAAETLGELTDQQVLERLLTARDDAAFEALVRRHGPMVYRVCWRVLQQAEDTEDAFQATFLVLARKLPTVRKRHSLASWLHGVAHRVALDAKANAARRRRHEARAAAHSRPGPPEEITWGELRTVLDAELGRLPEKWRLPLVLCYLEGRSQEEAAQQLGWSKSTLLRRLEEARAALGRCLTRRGVIWPAALSAVLLSDCVAPASL